MKRSVLIFHSTIVDNELFRRTLSRSIHFHWILLTAFLIGMLQGCVATGPGVRNSNAMPSKHQQKYQEANRRWQGTLCQNRIQLVITDKKDGNGWSKARWLFWEEGGGNERVQVLFTDYDAIRQRYPGGVIPVGSRFRATGWEIDDSDNLFMQLKLVDIPADVKVYFYDDWVGRVPLSHITDFEQWVRFDFLEILSAPEEALVPVEAVPSPPMPGLGYSPAEDVPTPLTIEIMATAVEPNRVAPGGEVQLETIYSLAGVSRGATIGVREVRTIMQGDQVLSETEAVVQRGSGVHQSSQSLRIPMGIEDGFYKFRVRLEETTDSISGTAIFEVRRGR